MRIFDKLMTKKNWARLQLTHIKVTTVGYNDREEASFEDSTTTSNSFYAMEGEDPDYNSDQKVRDWSDSQIELKTFEVPSNMSFNEFINEGVRDRITVESYGTQVFEVWSVDTDRFWGRSAQIIFLRPIHR